MLHWAWRGRRTASAADLRRSVSPVSTTSFLPPFKVRVTNGGVYGYAKFAYRFMRRRRSNHRQSICVAGRCTVLPRFSEHWRRWHSSDLRQRRRAGATTFMSSGVSWRHFRVAPSLFYQLFTFFFQNTNHSFLVLYTLMTRKTTALYQGVFEKLHALILQ